MQVDTAIRDYINELETSIKELTITYEARIKKLELKNSELKEEINLLLYKKFAQSAERLIADKK